MESAFKVGMGLLAYPPIPVSDEGQRLTKLGITLENGWRGKIRNITKLRIELPDSLKLSDCDANFTELEQTGMEGCEERCDGITECLEDCRGYRFYELSEKDRNKTKNIEQYKTFNCQLVAENKYELLGDSPISIQYIRVLAEYNYAAEAYKVFSVRSLREDIDLNPNLGSGTYTWPITSPVITSCYGERNVAESPWHQGIDIAGSNSAVKAVADGRVYYKCEATPEDNCGGYGSNIILYHPSTDMYTRYSHLSEIMVREGITVSAGRVIGITGNTGLVIEEEGGTGEHLDFRISDSPNFPLTRNDYSYNPLCYLPQPNGGYQYSANANSCKDNDGNSVDKCP